MSVDIGEFKPARCLDHGSDVCECSGLRAELAAARDEIERLRPYGDGPERGNAQTWAFMAAECARLLRERDEARREVKRLRSELSARTVERDLDNAAAWHYRREVDRPAEPTDA